MRSLLLAGLLTLSTISPAAAVEWEYIGRAVNEPFDVYLEVDSVQTDGTFIYYYSKLVGTDRTVISRRKMSCTNSQQINLAIYTIGVYGNLVSSFEIPPFEQESRPILPNTISAAFWERLCQ